MNSNGGGVQHSNVVKDSLSLIGIFKGAAHTSASTQFNIHVLNQDSDFLALSLALWGVNPLLPPPGEAARTLALGLGVRLARGLTCACQKQK